jgi:hypothetical protein
MMDIACPSGNPACNEILSLVDSLSVMKKHGGESMKKSQWEMPSDVLAVHSEIEAWRSNREKRTPIPTEIWSSAVGLAERYSVHRISRALGLNYRALKHRLIDSSEASTKLSKANTEEASRCEFIELSGVGMMTSTGGADGAIVARSRDDDHVRMEIELCDRAGGRMTVRVSDGSRVNLPDLVSSFWSRSR